LKETAVMVSIEVGQLRVCVGVDDGRLRSYREMTDDDAATVGSVLCRVIPVNEF